MACLVFSLTQVVLIALLFNAALCAISKEVTFYHLALTNLLILLFPLSALVSGDFIFTFYLYSVSYHTGAFIMALMSLLFALRELRAHSRRNLWLLAVAVFLGAFNDKLFIPSFVFPLFALLLFFLVDDKKIQARRILVVTVLSTILALAVFSIVKGLGYIKIIGTDWKMFNFSNIIPSFEVMFRQYSGYIKNGAVSGVVIILTALAFMLLSTYIAAVLMRVYRNRKLGVKVRLSLYEAFALFAWGFLPMVIFTPIINGSYVSPAILRFNIHAHYFGVLTLGFFLVVYVRSRRRVALLSGFCIAVSFAGLAALYSSSKEVVSLGGLLNYYPERVKCIDSFASETRVKYGIAAYWDAKLSTMLSKRRGKALPCVPQSKNMVP
ncbi:MAG: hypothetical protein JW783_06075 [Bacteroidales bacterium]|nr:hypothetical protein [Bacteroidales bacterium]MBN2750283.1 hypothetical protein [Bacteroidales bacterium]